MENKIKKVINSCKKAIDLLEYDIEIKEFGDEIAIELGDNINEEINFNILKTINIIIKRSFKKEKVYLRYSKPSGQFIFRIESEEKQ